MRIALPMKEGRFCAHFGKSDSFRILEIDRETRQILASTTAPVNDDAGCQGLPAWLGRQGVSLVIAGGIGGGAVAGLDRHGIQVLPGAQPSDPDQMARDYLADCLACGANACEGHHHGHGHHHHHH